MGDIRGRTTYLDGCNMAVDQRVPRLGKQRQEFTYLSVISIGIDSAARRKAGNNVRARARGECIGAYEVDVFHSHVTMLHRTSL